MGSTENMTGSQAYRPGDYIGRTSGRRSKSSTRTQRVGWSSRTCSRGPKRLAGLPHRPRDLDGGEHGGARRLPRSSSPPTTSCPRTSPRPRARLWRMPLDRICPQLDSTIADLSTRAPASTITAALFLKVRRRCQMDAPRHRRAGVPRAGPRTSPEGGTGFGVAPASAS